VDQHVMPAATVVDLLGVLAGHGVDARLSGGWGVDALLGEQTRDHDDLDLWLPAAHLEPLVDAVTGYGLDRLFPWPGNRPWNFVLHDGGRLRVDLHLYEPLPDGLLHFGPVTAATVFPAAALDGHGVVAGTAVRCEAPQWSVRWHSGYPPRAKDRHDVGLLCRRFGIALPDGLATEPS